MPKQRVALKSPNQRAPEASDVLIAAPALEHYITDRPWVMQRHDNGIHLCDLGKKSIR